MPTTPMNDDMQQCIDDCLNCYRTCLRMAMTHCLEMGGAHVEPQHFRLMMDCVDICRTAADFMMRGSPLHSRICATCADICEACAQSCEQVGDMDECVQACRACAQSCGRMAQDGASMSLSGAKSGLSSAGRDSLPM